RVRQVESSFLADIVRRLDYFSGDRADLLINWSSWGDELTVLVSRASLEDADLLAGGLEAVFRESPQGIARQLAREALLDRALESLERDPDLWFGGTQLEDFVARVP